MVEGWRLSVLEFFGGRRSRHWLVEADGERFVLRASDPPGESDFAYEIEVLRRVAALGWQVPEPVAGPQASAGRQWRLFTYIPGKPPAAAGDAVLEQRDRGRLLAQFHLETAQLLDMGQRPGWRDAIEVVQDPALVHGLHAYERVRPADARVIRWHLEHAQELFVELDASTAPRQVLHGDFTPWNLCYEKGRLSGVLDFECTHLNLRVSDFALSWRGKDDEVVRGYREVTALDEREHQLITPAFWSWLMLGVARELQLMDSMTEPPRFEWTIAHLLRRTPLMGTASAPYRA